MTFLEYLRQQQQLVDDELERLVPSAATPPETIHRAMRYSLFAGGKRIRPVLCLEAARAVADRAPGVERAAGALEMVRNSWLNGLLRKLTFALALHHLLDFLLHRTARHTSRALGLGRHLLASRPLQLLPFQFVRDCLCIHLFVSQLFFKPAYFSTSFFSP